MARIVLIDDEARLLQTLARFLEQQGHEVVRGGSFHAVEEHLRPGRFEVLITDIVMPEFDGMKVLREVVEGRQCQEPVILITGEPNLQTASEAVRRGAFDYISKPVTKDKLLEAVSRGLRHVAAAARARPGAADGDAVAEEPRRARRVGVGADARDPYRSPACATRCAPSARSSASRTAC